jgi:glycosyltransferase involved in cell wall biosynthesis
MPTNVSVSVLMPVYNADRYVAEAVESILKQTFTDFEFIIINDGSTDNSLQLLEKYANQDARIKLVSRENRGLINTLNEGLALAQAPLIARMDADDVAFIDRFQLQVSFMGQHPEIACVGGYAEIIDAAGRALALMKEPEDNQQIQEMALKGHAPFVHPTTMLRKGQVEAAGGYRGEFEAAEDLDLWLRLGEISVLANIPHPLIKYRMLTNSVSGSNIALQRQSAFKACQQACKRRNVHYDFEYNDWRPAKNTKSIFAFHLKFGWWAFNYRQRRTAIIYGIKSVTSMPWNSAGWHLLICSLIKPLPTKS